MAKTILKHVGRVFACIGAAAVAVFVALLLVMKIICGGNSPAARQMFVTTILETGALKFLASWYLTPEEINQVVATNSMKELNSEVDTSLITFGKNNDTEYVHNGVEGGNATVFESTGSVYEEIDEDPDGDGIIIKEVTGRTFWGYMMIVKDPKRAVIESYYGTYRKGASVDTIVKEFGGVAAVNGGIYYQVDGKERPYGLTVTQGKIETNKPQEQKGMVFIGLNEDNILIIHDISQMTAAECEKWVEEQKIRDGCCFQEESGDKNNHFVQLIINGEAREMNGMGSGCNPRTAIGQRADGALLFLVTDGRGTQGHLGASASDLITVMQEFGAVNAANLDGGSSSVMYYNDEYLMSSVTFVVKNTSWNLPLAWVIK